MDNLFEHFHSYTDLLNEGHCIMVDIDQRGKILEFVSQISNECVYEEEGKHYGKELNPHVTVMYGLNENEEKRVKELLAKVPKKISATLGKISKFENIDAPYDVLKVEVYSPHLAKIHEMIRGNFENDYKWPEYNPHVTLAYVKKGTCNEYVGNKMFEGMKIKFENFTYSNGNREQNHKVNMKEYYVGQSAGYGGGAMTGGAVAPTNWAGTFSSNQTSRRLNDYPASRRYTYMQGNTVIGSSLYDTITQDDLKHTRFSPQEIFTGLRKEMSRMEYPDKDVAKKTVLKNLDSDPKFYSDLHMYFNSDKQGSNIMENIDPKEIEMGTKHEHEHTKDDALARKIAMDHLKDDPHYYTKLKKAGLEEDMGEGAMTNLEKGYIEEYGDIGMIAPSEPSIAVITISGDIDGGQKKLSSSGLGQSGTPKTLKSDKLVAPAEKNKVGPNSVAVSKTPSIGGQITCDPLDHYGAQMNEKW
jgi:2'-5' RNA ligase